MKLLLILVILLLLNIFFSDNQIVSFYNLLKLLQVYLLYFVFKHSKFDRNFLLSAFFWGMILQLLLSLWQLIKKGSVEIGFYWLGERHLDLFTADVAKVSFDGVQLLRPYGTFSHPNSLAGFYLLVYTFVLFFIKSKKGKDNANNLLVSLALIFSATLVFLSFSKVAVLCFLVVNLFYMKKRSWLCNLCLLPKVIIALLLSMFVFSLQSDLLTYTKRLFLFNTSVDIVKKNFFFGVGLGQYLYAQVLYLNRYPYFFLQPVHNIFLLFYAQTGLLLGIPIVYLLIKWFWNNRHKDAFVALLLVVLITGLFDHYWLTLQQNMLIMGAVLGIVTDEQS